TGLGSGCEFMLDSTSEKQLVGITIGAYVVGNIKWKKVNQRHGPVYRDVSRCSSLVGPAAQDLRRYACTAAFRMRVRGRSQSTGGSGRCGSCADYESQLRSNDSSVSYGCGCHPEPLCRGRS